MKMYQLTCPACGASVEIEQGRKSMFCSYCGKQIYLDDDTQRVEVTQNILYHEIYTDEAKIHDIHSRERIKRRESKQDLIAIAISFGIALALFVWLYIDLHFEEQASILQEQELQVVVNDILKDLEDGNFQEAYIKAETLYYTEGWSKDIEKKWNATRKELIKQIEAAEKTAKKQAEKESKNSTTWWNPFD